MDDWMPLVLPPEPCPRWLSPDRVLLDCRADVLASVRTGPVVRGADDTGSIARGKPTRSRSRTRGATPGPSGSVNPGGRAEPERTPGPRAHRSDAPSGLAREKARVS